jgi:hypothetical protein
MQNLTDGLARRMKDDLSSLDEHFPVALDHEKPAVPFSEPAIPPIQLLPR